MIVIHFFCYCSKLLAFVSQLFSYGLANFFYGVAILNPLDRLVTIVVHDDFDNLFVGARIRLLNSGLKYCFNCLSLFIKGVSDQRREVILILGDGFGLVACFIFHSSSAFATVDLAILFITSTMLGFVPTLAK